MSEQNNIHADELNSQTLTDLSDDLDSAQFMNMAFQSAVNSVFNRESSSPFERLITSGISLFIDGVFEEIKTDTFFVETQQQGLLQFTGMFSMGIDHLNVTNYTDHILTDNSPVDLTNLELPTDETFPPLCNPFDIQKCPICFDDFNTGDNIMVPTCNHIVHSSCCRKWVDTKIDGEYKAFPSCPVCKMEFTNEK